jgi:hypothetical protein
MVVTACGYGNWLRAQATHDIEVAQSKLGKTLKTIKPWSSRAAS